MPHDSEYDYATPQGRSLVRHQLMSRQYDERKKKAVFSYLDQYLRSSNLLSIKVRTLDQKRGVALTINKDGKRTGYVDFGKRHISCKIHSNKKPLVHFDHAEAGQVLAPKGKDGYIIYLTATNWQDLLNYTLEAINVPNATEPSVSKALRATQNSTVSKKQESPLSDTSESQGPNLPQLTIPDLNTYETKPTDPNFAAVEGKDCYRKHRKKERNKKLIVEKKRQALRKDPLLRCEVCRFSFVKTYGEWGKHFAEVHHKTPLSSHNAVIETKLEDLAIICSNCHSMLHRQGHRTLTIEELKQILNAATHM